MSFVYAGVDIACSSGSVSPSTSKPLTPPSCIINSPLQTITLSSSYVTKYYFDELTLNSGAQLKFTSSSTCIYDVGVSKGCSCTYISGGSGGVGNHDSDGADGGDGGKGGCFLGGVWDGNKDSRSETSGGSRGSLSGGYVIIYAKKITINGIINLSGSDATKGGDGWQRDLTGCDDGATGGGGGGAGGSGGYLILVADTITGINSVIDVHGGNAGVGGKGGDDDDSSFCSANDDGGGGGGGVGGAGGKIEFFYTTNTISGLITITVAGSNGGGGAKGGYGNDGGGPGQNPSTETSNIAGSLQAMSPEKCNNGEDEDFDFLIDMQDPDCFNIIPQGLCPSSNYGPVSGPITNINVFPAWFVKTSTTGLDGCCGDDDWLNGGFER